MCLDFTNLFNSLAIFLVICRSRTSIETVALGTKLLGSCELPMDNHKLRIRQGDAIWFIVSARTCS